MVLSKLLDQLESYYGTQTADCPTDPYLFLIWWHCGYPASDASCEKGWQSLKHQIGVKPRQILTASGPDLARALKPGGMVPELRATRLQEIAARVQDEFGGNLAAALAGPLAEARKTLKKFPSIADPGADRILLFGGVAPIAAIPSNSPRVLVRIQRGREGDSYGATYREAKEIIETGVRAQFDDRIRAYLLLKRHGQETCKNANPRCDICPVRADCAFLAAKPAGKTTASAKSPGK